MNDNTQDRKARQEADGGNRTDEGNADADEQELTFEHGYGAQEGVLSGDETLAEVAGVSEEEVRDDLLGARRDNPDEAEDEPDAEERTGEG